LAIVCMSARDYRVSRQGSELHVILAVEKFDALRTAEFLEAVEKHWDASIEAVTVDLRQVAFIDSSGVGALLTLSKKMAGQPCPVTLLQPQEHVLSVLEMLRLHRVFKLVTAD